MTDTIATMTPPDGSSTPPPPIVGDASMPLHPDLIGSTPILLPGLGNFARIDNGVFRGCQPTPQGFATLAKLGIHHDIDLRTEYDELADLRPSKPWYYAYAPSDAWTITPDYIANVVKTMMTAGNLPIYVHCLHGSDRTGAVCATYRIIAQRWSPQAALNEMATFGFHTIFTNISAYIGGMDVEDMRARVDRASGLSFQIIR